MIEIMKMGCCVWFLKLKLSSNSELAFKNTQLNKIPLYSFKFEGRGVSLDDIYNESPTLF